VNGAYGGTKADVLNLSLKLQQELAGTGVRIQVVPGNVRELRNILERAAVLCDGGLITPDDLAITVTAVPRPPVLQATAALATQLASPMPNHAPAGDLHSLERTMIEQAPQTARFNKSKAAKALGLTRHPLYIRMRKHGFES
jgi:two-component system, NtrC family, response regulator PilR